MRVLTVASGIPMMRANLLNRLIVVHLAEQIFGKGLFVDEAEKPPVNGDAMTCE